LHEKGIMHRDIKGGNLLLDKNGVLKIADFGLAREFIRVNSAMFTTKVVTRWYRAPELLLSNPRYTSAIDIWSIGCFVAEMFIGGPIFPGVSDLE
jgi:cyclin-dependent kinase 12/13